MWDDLYSFRWVNTLPSRPLAVCFCPAFSSSLVLATLCLQTLCVYKHACPSLAAYAVLNQQYHSYSLKSLLKKKHSRGKCSASSLSLSLSLSFSLFFPLSFSLYISLFPCLSLSFSPLSLSMTQWSWHDGKYCSVMSSSSLGGIGTVASREITHQCSGAIIRNCMALSWAYKYAHTLLFRMVYHNSGFVTGKNESQNNHCFASMMKDMIKESQLW